nr:hypothetical protein [uncultured Senegalimassilia sp.]
MNTDLLGNAHKLRRARRFDLDASVTTGTQNVSEQLLVLLNVDAFVRNVLATPNRYQKEHRVIHRAQSFCEPSDAAHLVAIPINHSGVNLEWQADAFAGFDSRQRCRMCTVDSAKFVMLLRVKAVNADTHGARTRRFQLSRDVLRNQGSVAAEHRSESA